MSKESDRQIAHLSECLTGAQSSIHWVNVKNERLRWALNRSQAALYWTKKKGLTAETKRLIEGAIAHNLEVEKHPYGNFE